MSSPSKITVPHTKVDRITEDGEGERQVRVVPIPILSDNYSYLLLHPASRTAALVDPADPYPIVKVLQDQYSDYKLTTILTTHKHWDHAGGNLELLKQFPDLTVIGGPDEGVAGATKELTTGSSLDISGETSFHTEVFHCPCHTRGHIIYKIGRLLFTGDTLFTGGCGRFFEGDAKQMFKNLHHTIGKMSDDTIVFPGHEYTVANLEFAVWVDPSNDVLSQKYVWSQERRAGLFPTVPSTLAEEKSYNPFMRTTNPDIINRLARVIAMQPPTGSQEEIGVKVTEILRNLKNENAHKKKA